MSAASAMIPERLRGVIGACLTPFREDGLVDEIALSAEIDFMVGHVDAVAIGAVEASEFRVLTETQRDDLIRVGIQITDRRVPAIAGASGTSTSIVLGLIERAAAHGADFAQILMPRSAWGGQLSGGELIEFFSEISTRSPLPLILYHNPSTGSDPDVGTYVELSALDRVVAFKESSRDITKLSRLIHEVDVAGRASYFTTMQPMLITMLLGGAGATMPPPGTRIAAHVRDALAEGDMETAVAWQRIFAFFPAIWSRYGLASVMKAASRHVGLDLGSAHPPVTPIPEDSDHQLGVFIQGCGLIDSTPVGAAKLMQLVNGL